VEENKKGLNNKQIGLLVLIWAVAVFLVWQAVLPWIAEYNYRKAYLYDANKRMAQSIPYYNKAVKYAPWETYYRVQLGGIYEKISDKKQGDEKLKYLKLAENEYQKCTEISWRNPWYQNRLGSVYLKYSQLETDPEKKKALVVKQQEKIFLAGNLDKNNGIFQTQAAYLYYSKGDFEKAEKILAHIMNDIDERLVDPYMIQGDIYRKRGELDKMVALYEKAVSLNMREPKKMDRLYYQLGAVYESRKEYHKAVEMYKRSMKINRNNATPAKLLKRAAYLGKDYASLKVAAKILALKHETNIVENYILYIKLANKQTELQEIKKMVKLAKLKFPNHPEVKKLYRIFIK